MNKIFVYTKKGERLYFSGNASNYSGLKAYNCDLNDAMHLALSVNNGEYVPMRNDTGILFPKADLFADRAGGVTKTLLYPWVFRMKDNTFGVIAVRRNQNAPDQESVGSVMLFFSDDMIRFREVGFLRLSDSFISRPHCRFEQERQAYYIEWKQEKKWHSAYTNDFVCVTEEKIISVPVMKEEKSDRKDVVGGNSIEVSDKEAKRIADALGVIENTGVSVPPVILAVNERINENDLPKAVCAYSDGSIHEKAVDWNKEQLKKIDFSRAGCYRVDGVVRLKHYPFPFIDENISDPSVYEYQGKYFLSHSDLKAVKFRISDSIEGLRETKPVTMWRVKKGDSSHANIWAQELHVIKGIPYVFTTVGSPDWTTVRSHVLRCHGDASLPENWEEPRLVVRPDGTELEPDGISLDMTCFEDSGLYYVMWSNRIMYDRDPDRAVADSADIYIATVDPDHPWRLTSDPVCILRPLYGWDRCQTAVDEGPYVLKHNGDLFVTISGSSTALADLYCLGLLKAKAGTNLLLKENWEWLGYPVLTKESVVGEFGPGHNTFVKDPETDDDLLVYHAVPHAKNHRARGRYMGIRRVHWKKDGYPYFEMTEERDLRSEFKNVTLQITIK